MEAAAVVPSSPSQPLCLGTVPARVLCLGSSGHSIIHPVASRRLRFGEYFPPLHCAGGEIESCVVSQSLFMTNWPLGLLISHRWRILFVVLLGTLVSLRHNCQKKKNLLLRPAVFRL